MANSQNAPLLKFDDLQLFQPNVITQARYHFSEYERRVLVFIVKHIQDQLNNNTVKLNRDLFGDIDYKIEFYLKELYLDDGEKVSHRVKKALTDLRHRDIEVEDEDQWFTVGFIENPKLNKESGKWSLKISADLMPYLISCAKGFTQYQLNTALQLTYYSHRLYMMMSQFADTGLFRISAEKLRYELAVEEKYITYNSFKHGILARSMKEIKKLFDNSSCDLFFTISGDQKERSKDDWDRTIHFKIICPERNSNQREHKYDPVEVKAYHYILAVLKYAMPNNQTLRNKIAAHLSTSRQLGVFAERLLKIESQAEAEKQDLTGYAPLIVHIVKTDFGYGR